jgi:hypothetical protein
MLPYNSESGNNSHGQHNIFTVMAVVILNALLGMLNTLPKLLQFPLQDPDSFHQSLVVTFQLVCQSDGHVDQSSLTQCDALGACQKSNKAGCRT